MIRVRRKSRYLLVRNEGNSRVLTVTTFLPTDWQMVEVKRVTKHKDSCISVTFKKVA